MKVMGGYASPSFPFLASPEKSKGRERKMPGSRKERGDVNEVRAGYR